LRNQDRIFLLEVQSFALCPIGEWEWIHLHLKINLLILRHSYLALKLSFFSKIRIELLARSSWQAENLR
jgi:hypothetical protein